MNMKFGVLALAAVCMVVGLAGCEKGSPEATKPGGDSNMPATTGANNTPDANNATAMAPAPAANEPLAKAPDSKSMVNPDPKVAAEHDKKVGTVKSDFDNSLVRKDAQAKKLEPAKVDKGSAGVAEAKKLATSVDMSMKKLTNAKLHFEMGAILPEGHGDVNDEAVIGDQKRFLLRYAKFIRDEHPHFETFTVARQKDGAYKTLVGQKYVPGRIAPEADPLDKWVTDSTHYITSGIGTDKKPLAELVTAAEKAKWKINVETKTYDIGTYKRIIMESRSTPRKRFEIMVEPKQQLLVSFNADIDDKKPSRVSLNMTTMKKQHGELVSDQELSPKVAMEGGPITVLSPEEARKRGIYVPGGPKERPKTEKPPVQQSKT